MAGYSGTPLVKKLGVKAGHTIILIDPPEGFALELPEDVRVRSRLGGHLDLALVFVVERAALERRIQALGRAVAPDGSIWVAWPKKASRVPTDMTEHVVREVALPLGLVDVKVAAVDDVWSGLKLVWRLSARRGEARAPGPGPRATS
jgi:hypothetical protein